MRMSVWSSDVGFSDLVRISNVDYHLLNLGFLCRGKAGWSLSPAYDLNPVPADLKARVLTTNIDLLEVASAFFALPLPTVRAIIKEVAVVTATWRDTPKTVGARPPEITPMARSFAPRHPTPHLPLRRERVT